MAQFSEALRTCEHAAVELYHSNRSHGTADERQTLWHLQAGVGLIPLSSQAGTSGGPHVHASKKLQDDRNYERIVMVFAGKLIGWSLASMLVVGTVANRAAAAPPSLAERNDLGYTTLQQRLSGRGILIPTGRKVPLTQVETNWVDPNGPPNVAGAPTIRYMPDGALSDFLAKRIVDRSLLSNPPGATSGHATNMGVNLYGSEGLAPGVSHIDCYFSGQWMFRNGLRTGSDEPPVIERNRVQNHSWIGSVEVGAGDTRRDFDPEILARFDWQLDRDNVVAAVGLTHDDKQPLLGRAFNCLAVGRSTGGALRPDLVAPASSPSVATTWVSATAAMLIEISEQWQGVPEIMAAGKRNEVIRAAIMAGATKVEAEYTGGDRVWRRTAAEPLSPLFGAGELQIDHAYRIYCAGRHEPGRTTMLPSTGWDLRQMTPEDHPRYYFEVARGDEDQDLSIIATWNRQIDPLTLQGTLANVDLKLYDADQNFVLLKVFGDGSDDRGVSAATNDNVEHIYLGDVPPGRYALEISTDLPADVAVAWDVRSSRDAVPRTPDNPAMRATWLVLGGLLGVFVLWALFSLLRLRAGRSSAPMAM